ncbi:MAG TPA: hypothetical protein VL944_01295 [Candidatus Acidoferrum sp.]|nr:hypothetical protein [Candidatus Acidoferrum sp.]
MYYHEFERVKRMEGWLEKLAYISVILDFMISLATLLILKGENYSHFVLTVTGWLITVEMAIIGVLFVALVALKHYNSIMDNFAMAAFKNVKIRRASNTFRKVVVSPIVIAKRLFTSSY